jgi:protease I
MGLATRETTQLPRSFVGFWPASCVSYCVDMGKPLAGKNIAILCTNGVEQSELVEPREALEKAGAQTDLVSPATTAQIHSAIYHEPGENFAWDVALSWANPDDYDALVLPGGVANDDELRVIPEAVKFVRSFFESHKPIAAICHGPWMLVEADIARGHTLTSWPSLKTDICNAGGNWVDREVVQDGLLTTSRKPNDLPAFIREMLKSFAASA